VIDHTGLAAQRRDGLLPRSESIQRFFRKLGETGIPVIEPTPLLLPAHLDISPWGNPPHREAQHHGSPQAIDRTADVTAALLAPRLASRFDQVGARQERVRLQRSEISPSKRLFELVTSTNPMAVMMSPRIPDAVAQVQLAETRLEVLIDLDKLEARNANITASAIGLRSTVRTFVLEDMRGRLIDELRVRFVRFSNYDEYGRGSLEDAEVAYEALLNIHSLELLQ
jgi:hypothetical protein